MFFVGLFTTTCTTCSSQVIRCGVTTRYTCVLFLIAANVSFVSSQVIHYPAFCLAPDSDYSGHLFLCSLESGIARHLLIIPAWRLFTSFHYHSICLYVIINSIICQHTEEQWFSSALSVWLVTVCCTESNGSFLQISQLLLSLC